jgi:integrase
MTGIDLTTVKGLLGHKDIKMTLRYAHLSRPHIRNAVKALDNKDFQKNFTVSLPQGERLKNNVS